MEEVAYHFCGSERKESKHFQTLYNPYNQEKVSIVPLCTVEDALEALEVAKESFRHTKNSPLSSRIAWLEDVVQTLLIRQEDIAMTITRETGKPITFSRVEVQRCIETIRLAIHAALSLTGETILTDAMPSGKKTTAFTKRVAAGVVVAITPFNFPLNLVAHKLAPALVSGCSVVLKPTPEAPVTASKLAQIFIESPYALKDALSVVYGDAEVGNALVTSPIARVISFTGSVPVGKIIMKNAGIKKVALELGGNAATYIDKTADIAYAAKRCAMGAFINSGQVCISLQRIYVANEVYNAFSQALAHETQKLVVGSPYDEETFIGPLINEEAARRAIHWIQSAINEGAKVIAGGRSQGAMVFPTLLVDVHDEMKVVCEEIFAPVVSLVRVKSFDEAIEKINTSPYGLHYSLFSNDLSQTLRAIDEFECGGVVVNDIPTLRFDIQPYGGIGESGVGREGPFYAIEEFTEIKSIVIVPT